MRGIKNLYITKDLKFGYQMVLFVVWRVESMINSLDLPLFGFSYQTSKSFGNLKAKMVRYINLFLNLFLISLSLFVSFNAMALVIFNVRLHAG